MPPDAAASTGLLACPTCDLLVEIAPLPLGGRLRCRRCRTLLVANRPAAIGRALAASLASAVLVTAALALPFLDISILGIHRRASILDVARAYANGWTLPLAVATMLAVAVVPILRAVALAWTLLPLQLGRRALPGARPAFRLALALGPWSMAEIFLVGVAVAVMKLGAVASVAIGPAFWVLVILVLVLAFEAASLCERSVWLQLDPRRPA